MEVEVVEVLEFYKISVGFNIKVRAKTLDGKLFDYVFIKTNLDEVNLITTGFKWFVNCKPKIY